MTNWQNIWTSRTRDAIKAALAPCFANNCTVTNLKHLEFAHLKPTKLQGRERGRADRLTDVLANPDCYALLCEEHHEDFDKEEIHSWMPKSMLEVAEERGLELFRVRVVA